MLTRDISLDDCILDLIDNSIDGAWQLSGDHPSEFTDEQTLAAFEVNVEISAQEFRISDNCGGITLDNAASYAFTFGRVAEEPKEDFSVGVYGIGMKRAIFKLGAEIEVRSTYVQEGTLEAFCVPINVQTWVENKSPSWDFDIDEADPMASPGVDIVVRRLSEETSKHFEDPTYASSLRDVLGRDYMLPLLRGLTITVNGVTVTGRRVEFRHGADFVPMRHAYGDEGVRVEILAGMTAPPPDDLTPDSGKVRTDAGWYVMCNGRVVVAADRSVVTGWGLNGAPAWHPQFNGFVGIALFSAADPELLPMTTTKRNVDVSSAVYRRALVNMSRPVRAWVDYTNARKQDLEAARERETAGRAVDVIRVPDSPQVGLPTIARSPLREQVANVNYAVPLKKMRRLATAFGSAGLTYREVGVRSFDFTYEQLTDDD